MATAIIEKLHQFYPESQIDFLLRKGNEQLLEGHPLLNQVFIWNKKNKKYDNLKALTRSVKEVKYDSVINLQRFASSGLITAFSGAKEKVGFKKNPLSFSFTKKVPHRIGNRLHETERNQLLIEHLTDKIPAKPKLYPAMADYDEVESLKVSNYVCMAPTSVWFTKQLPMEQWEKLIKKTNDNTTIYLLGAPSDIEVCEDLKNATKNSNVINLCGKLSLLQSAALMQTAQMNYVNDSAPLHLASAMNAPVTAYFCSTVPDFGFTPLSDNSTIVEVKETLACRPCGIHGKKACPEKHFKCGYDITV